jgi:hypothetical protein
MVAGDSDTDTHATYMYANSSACASHIGAGAYRTDIGACTGVLGTRCARREQCQGKYRCHNGFHDGIPRRQVTTGSPWMKRGPARNSFAISPRAVDAVRTRSKTAA